MNVKRTLRLGAVAAWLLALSPMLPTFGSAASGATLDAYGWWNRNQALPVQGDPTGLGLTTVPTVPAPATVPEDGINVANDASGASAIGAVRYRLEGRAGGTLTLDLADGAALTGTEAVVACPVQGGFTPAQNGRWDAAPAYDPATCVIAGEPTEEGAAFTFDVPATFASALGDVAVVIAPEPGNATPFSLAFAKPTDDSFTVTTPVVAAPSAPPPAPAFQPGTAVFTPAPASGSFSAPAPASPTTTVAAPTGGDGVAAAAPAGVPASTTTDENRAAKYAAVAMLFAIGAAFWWLAKQPSRMPKLLGSVGGGATAQEAHLAAVVRTGRTRGIGRFARHRSAPPTPI